MDNRRLAKLFPLSMLLLAACGQEADDATGTVLPQRPDEKIIEGTNEAPATDSDPTPQAGVGGRIPGYDAAEEDEAEPREEPAGE